MLAVAVLVLCLLWCASAGAASLLYVRGGGNGHGVGMSQYGAYGYALHGKSYRWILAHYYSGTTLGTSSPSQTVRVLLGPASGFSGASKAGTKKLEPNLTYSVAPNADGTLTVLDARGKKVGTFPAPLSVTGPGPLTIAGGGTYRGSLELRPGPRASVQAIDVVGLEDYVRGVIAAEMPSGWAAQALEAQAVAARTYALTSDAGGSAFDLYADTRSQMYGGVDAETAAGDAAVAATADQIVLYRGNPAITYFFSSSGGHTENVEDVWPGLAPAPWLRGVSDAYDGAAGDPYHRWRLALPLRAAQRRLRSYVRGGLVGVEITRRGVSPRIVTAKVVGTAGAAAVSGSQLQRALALRSTLADFTTITTAAQAGSPGHGSRRPGPRGVTNLPSRAVLTVVERVRELLLGPELAGTGLRGNVFPSASTGRVVVQVKGPGGWRTVGHVSLGAGGDYAARVHFAGVYRVVYEGLAGPTVTVR